VPKELWQKPSAYRPIENRRIGPQLLSPIRDLHGNGLMRHWETALGGLSSTFMSRTRSAAGSGVAYTLIAPRPNSSGRRSPPMQTDSAACYGAGVVSGLPFSTT
jgi:hypothetical protein